MKKFIELLRKGTHEAAIGCLRTCVAPCALDAYPVLEYSIPCCLSLFCNILHSFIFYCFARFLFLSSQSMKFWPLHIYLKEAYEEFKHVLLALIYDKSDQTSPVAHEVCHASALDIIWSCGHRMFFFFWTAAIHHAEFVFWIIRNCTFCSSVGREKKVWNGWTDVICLESFFASIWSTIFNDTKISDKVYSFSTLLLSIVFFA